MCERMNNKKRMSRKDFQKLAEVLRDKNVPPVSFKSLERKETVRVNQEVYKNQRREEW